MMYTASGADLRIKATNTKTIKSDNIIFRNKEHEEFYYTILSKCRIFIAIYGEGGLTPPPLYI